MLARSVLVKVMLGALAVSAAAGVALVFVPGLPQMGRVAGSGAILLVACGMLLFNGEPGPDDRMTVLQRTWASWVGVGAAGALALTWLNAGSGHWLAVSWWAWILYGLGAFAAMRPALRSISLAGARPYRTGENILFLGGVLAFAVGFAGAASLGWDERGMVIPWTVLAILANAAVAAGGARALGQGAGQERMPRMDRQLALACAAASAVSAALWIALVADMWRPLLQGTGGIADPGQPLLPCAIAAATAAVSLALWCAMRALRLAGWASMLPALASAVTAAAGTLITVASLEGFAWIRGSDAFARTVGALAIVDAAALVAIAVAARAARATRGSGDFARPIASMRARCARCAASMELAPGENACRTCGLVTVIGFRDDRCPACGYDLRASGQPSCAECGRARQHAGLHAT
jgi:hypothetical protein